MSQKDIVVSSPQEPNLEQLDAELRSIFNEIIFGVSANHKEVIVHLTEEASENQLETARELVLAHNPARLTQAQQAAKQLQTEREKQLAIPLMVQAFENEPESVQQLAEKIAWLELEILTLREHTFGLV